MIRDTNYLFFYYFYIIIINTNNLNHKMITASEIRKANPQGKMTMVSGTNEIVFENGVKFDFVTSLERSNAWNKMSRMGFETPTTSFFGQDELEGICMAANNGENPFACTIICANPSMNSI